MDSAASITIHIFLYEYTRSGLKVLFSLDEGKQTNWQWQHMKKDLLLIHTDAIGPEFGPTYQFFFQKP